jgi:hypothetical protein
LKNLLSRVFTAAFNVAAESMEKKIKENAISTTTPKEDKSSISCTDKCTKIFKFGNVI